MKPSTRLCAGLKFLAVLHITEQLLFGMQDLHDLQHMIAVYDRWTGNASAGLALLATIGTGLAVLMIRGILKGGSARFAAMFILGLPTIGELHHLVETMRTGHYTPGTVTAVPSVICGVLFLQRLTQEFRSSRTIDEPSTLQLAEALYLNEMHYGLTANGRSTARKLPGTASRKSFTTPAAASFSSRRY